MYLVTVTVHVLAAMLWLGGMMFIALAAAPVLRAVEPPELRQRLFQAIGLRFRSAGWVAIAVLLVTGVANLYHRGWLGEDALLSGEFWRSAHGHALAVKLVAVASMVGFSAVHDFVVGPAASRATAGTPRAIQLRRRAMFFARVNAVLGIVVVAAAVRLAR